ncbi:MAG: hypothetical protein V1738_06505 [Patescibacteria group bacterium]
MTVSTNDVRSVDGYPSNREGLEKLIDDVLLGHIWQLGEIMFFRVPSKYCSFMSHGDWERLMQEYRAVGWSANANMHGYESCPYSVTLQFHIP